jgi:Pyridoxamine 5'-phosphate oxidase
MGLSADEISFLDQHHSAAMITVGTGGTVKAVRVGVAFVDGKLWSSGTSDRVRTRRLRENPQCTLFVFDSAFAWLTLETTVSILDGPDAPAQNLRLFRQMQGKPSGPLHWFGGSLDEDEFLRRMSEEGRLIYEFDVHHSYGLH